MMHGIAQDFVRYVMHVQVGAAGASSRPTGRAERADPLGGATMPRARPAMQQAAGRCRRRQRRAAIEPPAAQPSRSRCSRS